MAATAAAATPTPAVDMVLGLDLLIEHVCGFLVAPLDILAASQVSRAWRAAVHRVQNRQSEIQWLSSLIRITDDPALNTSAKIGKALGSATAEWIAKSGVVPQACLLFFLGTRATTSVAAQTALTAKLDDVLPPTCRVFGCCAEGIVHGSVEIAPVSNESHAVSIMLVPSECAVDIAVGCIDSDDFPEEGTYRLNAHLTSLAPRFFTSGFTAAVVSSGDGYDLFDSTMDWYNREARTPNLTVAGAICGGGGQRLLCRCGNPNWDFFSGVLLLSIIPRENHVYSGCAGLSEEGDLSTANFKAALDTLGPVCAGDVCGALTFSCVGRFGWDEPAQVQKAIPGLPVVGMFGQGEFGQLRALVDGPSTTSDDVRHFSYTNFINFFGPVRT